MNQNGIALLMVLCALFLMSTMVMASYNYWFDIYYLAKNSQQRQKEKWILLGAEEKFVSKLIKTLQRIDSMIMNLDVYYQEGELQWVHGTLTLNQSIIQTVLTLTH